MRAANENLYFGINEKNKKYRKELITSHFYTEQGGAKMPYTI